MVILSALIWGASVLSRLIDRQLSGINDFSPAMRVLMGKIARFALIVLAVVIGLYAIGVDFTALTLISGAIGVGLGFGLQKVVSNLVSGIILLLDKSIKPGDVISVGETFGWITSLNARYVSVTMRDGREILIPNEDLITQQVQNWSFPRPFVRIDIDFGVSYKSDPHLVQENRRGGTAKTPARAERFSTVVCHMTGFGDSSIDFVLRFFISDPTERADQCQGRRLSFMLWDTLKEHGIDIPFPQRDIMIKEMPKGGARFTSGKLPD